MRRRFEAKAFEHGVLSAAREVLRNAEMSAEMEAVAGRYYAEPAPYLIRAMFALAGAGVFVPREIRDCKLRDESRGLLRGRRTRAILSFDKHDDRVDARQHSEAHDFTYYNSRTGDDPDPGGVDLFEFASAITAWQKRIRKRFYAHWPQTLRAQLTRWRRKMDAREEALRDKTRRARASKHFLSHIAAGEGGGKWDSGFSRAGEIPTPADALAYAVAHLTYRAAAREQREVRPDEYPFPGPAITDESQPIACCDKHHGRQADLDEPCDLRATGIKKIRETNPAHYLHQRVGELGAVCRHCLRFHNDCLGIVSGDRDLFVHDSIVRDELGVVIRMVGRDKPAVATLLLIDDQSSSVREQAVSASESV